MRNEGNCSIMVPGLINTAKADSFEPADFGKGRLVKKDMRKSRCEEHKAYVSMERDDIHKVLYDHNGNVAFEIRYDGSRRPLNGICGDVMRWELIDGERLIIDGDGEMDDYSSDSPPPWYQHEITSVEIREGVESVGKGAFSADITRIRSLTTLSIPSSLKKVGPYAFANTFLPSSQFPDSVAVDATALAMDE